MASYRVCFLNEIPRGSRLFRCCQRSIVIRSARSPRRAVEAAKKRFSRIEGIEDWKIRAGLIEMEEIALSLPENRPAAPHSHLHGPRQPSRIVAQRGEGRRNEGRRNDGRRNDGRRPS